MKDLQSLRDATLRGLSYFRDAAPVFRIRERTVDDIELVAAAFARRFIASQVNHEPRYDMRRREGETIFYLPEGARARVFHASGAIIAKLKLEPFEKLITDTTDKDVLTKRVIHAAKQVGIDQYKRPGEQLAFERLWQIKATGRRPDGEPGNVVLCRVVGAFRRYIHELPVWGRASAFVQLAGGDVIAAAGVDWRPYVEEPVDHVKVIDPQSAVDAILGELSSGVPGGSITADDYAPELFSLGYFSLPKRRSQAFMQPVYVAAFRTRTWAKVSRLIVVPAGRSPLEPICRNLSVPPRETVKPSPTVKRSVRTLL